MSKGHVHEGRELCLQDEATVRAEEKQAQGRLWPGRTVVVVIPSVPGVCHIHVPTAPSTLHSGIRLMWTVCVRHTVPVSRSSGGSTANEEVGVLTATTVPLNHPVTSIRHTHEGGDPTTRVL